jgi:hypothetical protein
VKAKVLFRDGTELNCEIPADYSTRLWVQFHQPQPIGVYVANGLPIPHAHTPVCRNVGVQDGVALFREP